MSEFTMKTVTTPGLLFPMDGRENASGSLSFIEIKTGKGLFP